ncbi:MAG: hypothetical protein J6T96_03480 [Bacteroidales bacterium]|nr:hypothetical protein [Bacteroidales bacterium]MBO7567914.1 hypothetical protein [Bacteroidales bacterium]
MNKKIIILLLAILPCIASAQKGRHFEFDYFVLELGFSNSFNGGPSERCNNKYFKGGEGLVHLEPIESLGYTPGFNLGLQFHHDCKNDNVGFITGITAHWWGNSYKYETPKKDVELSECNRVLSLGVPLYIKLSDELYNRQAYFYFGTQVDFNLNITTTQKVDGKKLSAKDYNEARNKINVPIIVGFNFTIINFRIGMTPMSIFNKDYEITLGGGQESKPFKDMNNMTFFANFAFTIPLSQWTVKRSYFLSRIF